MHMRFICIIFLHFTIHHWNSFANLLQIFTFPTNSFFRVGLCVEWITRGNLAASIYISNQKYILSSIFHHFKFLASYAVAIVFFLRHCWVHLFAALHCKPRVPIHYMQCYNIAFPYFHYAYYPKQKNIVIEISFGEFYREWKMALMVA